MNIYERLTSPSFDFVRSELEAHYLHDCTRNNSHLGFYLPTDPRQLTSLKAASKAINIETPLLRRLISNGELQGYKGISACGNRMTVIDLKQAEHFAARLPPMMNIAQAANRLKLPINTIKVLCKNGYFTCLGGRPAAGQSWWIDASSFDMSNTCVMRRRSCANSLSLSNALRHPFMSEEGVAHLFESIQEGKLSVSLTDKSDANVIGEWRLVNTEWQAWIRAHAKQMADFQSLSVLQAAKILSITNDVAYALIRYGLLNSNVEFRNGISSHRITSNAIEKFKQTYIVGKEIAEILCLSSLKATAHMKMLGMVPVAGPSASLLKCRQYIWLKGPCFELIGRRV